MRLLISYSQAKQGSAPATTAQCTGLGVLVGSGLTGNQQVNWVLTDAGLLDTGKAQCVPAHPTATLSSIEVYMSSAYNSQQPVSPIATIGEVALKDAIHTQNNLALLSFGSSSIKLLPFLDLAVADPTPQAAIYLSKDVNSAMTPPAAISDAKQVSSFKPQIQQYLTPARKAITSQQDFISVEKEAGMPLVNSTGELAAITTINGKQVNSTDISKLLQTIDAIKNPPSNVVHDKWNNGITTYYRSQYADAEQAFNAAAQANSQFEGAQKFAQIAHDAAQSAVAKPRSTSTPVPSQGENINAVPVWLMYMVGLLLIAAILMIISVFVRSRARKQQLEREFAQVDRQAALEAQRIMEEESQQRQVLTQQAAAPPQRNEPSPAQDTSPVNLQQIYCPNCGTRVLKGTTRCPNCMFWLIQGSQNSVQQEQPVSRIEHSIVNSRPVASSVDNTPATAGMPEVVLQHSPDVASPANLIRGVSAHEEPEKVVYVPAMKIGEIKDRGRRLGNYRLVGSLGHGGFADVYLGEHVYLKTQSAIKVLHTRLSNTALRDFLHEARTIADLVHPHIIRVLEFGVEGNEPDLESSLLNADGCIPYLIMDYAPGGTLRARHPKGQRLSLATILPYVRDVAEGLQYAHDKKLIHRDIKPENMLIGRNNEVLLSDFGIAAVAHSEHSMSTQEMAGTIPYMAPEQIFGKPRPASDQYALGIVIYEWLCGSRPFQGSQWEIMEQHRSAFPLPLSKRGVSVPTTVEAVVMKVLAKDPSQRFDSVRAFAEALEQASLTR
ncbi:hypothetical protein KSF_068370 [Reticulibacter mediterranei]|uniref:Protein kinase domain-containing protein n=1 Tax=Reticulibacter mediterranei TaxID=2778369 RepID=A0A8J3N359_9CHLR|nr:hypothetical protein KSF_068370 [Reticulibacter mediterranei]